MNARLFCAAFTITNLNKIYEKALVPTPYFNNLSGVSGILVSVFHPVYGNGFLQKVISNPTLNSLLNPYTHHWAQCNYQGQDTKKMAITEAHLYGCNSKTSI